MLIIYVRRGLLWDLLVGKEVRVEGDGRSRGRGGQVRRYVERKGGRVRDNLSVEE